VAAAGHLPLSYQWQHDGVDLSDGERIRGAQTASLEIAAVEEGDVGAYRVSVRNACGSTTSAVARLRVQLQPPVIMAAPVDQHALSGSLARFSVGVSGSLPVSFQWRCNGVALTDGDRITGAQTATLNIAAAGIEDLGVYTVLVHNAYGSVTSAPANLTLILRPPDITSDPVDQSVFSGAPASFSVSATGSLPLGYQWQRDGADLADGGRISGAGAATLTIAAAEPEDLGLYAVEVRNAYGWRVSLPAQLTVILAPPTITGQPQGQTVALGTTVSVQVQATGSLPLSYQWQREGVDVVDGRRISGAKTSTLTISGLSLGDLGNYSVLVGNKFGGTQSEVASIASFSVVLQIRQDGAQAVVSWNEAGRGMKLQRASRLAEPDWQEVAGSESVTSVTLPVTEAGAAFFRLR
jgi:hypothetical protein